MMKKLKVCLQIKPLQWYCFEGFPENFFSPATLDNFEKEAFRQIMDCRFGQTTTRLGTVKFMFRDLRGSRIGSITCHPINFFLR
jgi:hypothetical protein